MTDISSDQLSFADSFSALTGYKPFPWQENLYERFVSNNGEDIPKSCNIPTGLGKTNVIAVWLIALANHPKKMPRRLVYVVNRRTVVDQTTTEVVKMRDNAPSIGIDDLAISTLRGQFADNREWSADPSRPAVICGTVDMIGSRLLFSGYRCGYKSKPLHAGFLGQDVLLVHDEAHLEPAFQTLIETIEKEQKRCDEFGRLRVMQLTATTRRSENETDEKPFGLTDDDRQHSVVKQRIEAKKALHLHSIDDESKELADELTDIALNYQDSGVAVLVFARTVENVEKVVGKLTKAKHSVTQLTGTLRGLERDQLVKTPIFQRLVKKPDNNEDIGTNADDKETVYLVCTSAGEVGVDISADHMVCDLSTFDSIIQRLGRVHRYGEPTDHSAQIHVVHPASFGKLDKKTGELKAGKLDIHRSNTLDLLKHRLKRLPSVDKVVYDASPKALSDLMASISEQERSNAFAPLPTILPATDILFDAWSMTTIREKMPGRPPVAPYLHGVADWEMPQTQVAWRDEVEIVNKNELLERNKPQELLEAFPLKPHELLHDRSDRVFKHLESLAKHHPNSPVWLVAEHGSVEVLQIEELADKKRKNRINHCTVILPPCIGGFSKGLLDGKATFSDDENYDISTGWRDENGDWQSWNNDKGKPRRWRGWDNEEPPCRMILKYTVDTNPDADEYESSDDESDGGSTKKNGRRWCWYVLPREAEDASHTSTAPITLAHHTKDVVGHVTSIIETLDVPYELKRAIVLAAELHDLGKQRELWQRSIGHRLPDDPKPEDWFAKSGGKNKRRGFRTDYRHEFGSLLDVLHSVNVTSDGVLQSHLDEFNQLDEEMRDFVLHLIATHHGRARPHFPMDEVYDPNRSQSQVDELSIEVPRRFARLQRKYGRWGLAYLESLLRAADWAASAEPSPIEEGNS